MSSVRRWGCDSLHLQRRLDLVPVRTEYGLVKQHGKIGVSCKGRGAGAFGDVSCFSFHATKVFHTVEGGAACFQDASVGQRLARLKNLASTSQKLP